MQALTVQLVQLRLVGNVGARTSVADCRASAECVVNVDKVATLREQVRVLTVTAPDREERLRRIADRLDTDNDDYYLGVDREETDQDRLDLEELYDQAK